MLSVTVKRLKNEPIEKPASTLIDIGYSSYIPRSYIPADHQRMDVYRRIAAAKDSEDLDSLSEELADLFGQVPEQVRLLLDITELRIQASKWEIRSIIVSERDLVFSFENSGRTGDLFSRAPGSVRVLDGRTVNIRLEKNYFEPGTLMSILRKMLRNRPGDNV